MDRILFLLVLFLPASLSTSFAILQNKSKLFCYINNSRHEDVFAIFTYYVIMSVVFRSDKLDKVFLEE